jgi:hypothetical protein
MNKIPDELAYVVAAIGIACAGLFSIGLSFLAVIKVGQWIF